MANKKNIRNVAIIAHVDHGKTTLVDGLLKTGGVFRENQTVQERIMDSNDIEKERGITILSKNTAVDYKDYKINIIDTPGHADFGGEVERVLSMADGVVLVVDAFEGPMPQTKFVLKKAFELNLPAIVCINKIDRPEARPEEVVDEILDLFIQLDAGEEYLDSPIVYASARHGFAREEYDGNDDGDMSYLLDKIIEYIPEPKGDVSEPFRLMISTTDYNDYVGRIGIGKIDSGTIKVNDRVHILNYYDKSVDKKVTITKIYEFQGLNRVEVESSTAGNIIAVTGVEGINIGDTICDLEHGDPIAFTKISEPTLAMNFLVNDSPFAGREGKFVTSRQIRNRLFKELETDVSLRVEETDSTDAFRVSGRGELHLSVLIENLRREGFEFQVSKPQVLYREEDGVTLEPIERVTIDVDEEYVGSIIEKLGMRKGELIDMKPSKGGYTRLVFDIPTRGLIGYRQEFISTTKGTGVINSELKEYAKKKGEIPGRPTGSLISFETGVTSAYGLNAAQERGVLFVKPGEDVYEGMVVGENPKGLDIEVNVCKKKAQTNIRSSAADEALRLSPPRILSLEELLEFIEEDELIEVTPVSLRIRKKILNSELRYKSKKNKN
ncbi:translational GTPase TypA [Lagierella massiliensis]|uniref:translational GTPase TypA n=1 Tax=Lagierella massiliensis TaxID=1689303 RepID=UPI0006D768BA|nr:translational GTPase TypA [Lagierella massiliensis]